MSNIVGLDHIKYFKPCENEPSKTEELNCSVCGNELRPKLSNGWYCCHCGWEGYLVLLFTKKEE